MYESHVFVVQISFILYRAFLGRPVFFSGCCWGFKGILFHVIAKLVLASFLSLLAPTKKDLHKWHRNWNEYLVSWHYKKKWIFFFKLIPRVFFLYEYAGTESFNPCTGSLDF